MKSIRVDKFEFSVYLDNVSLEQVNCFGEKQTIQLANEEGRPYQWTVILGNNNTGKTTILRCIALLEPEILENSDTVFSINPRGLTSNQYLKNSLYVNKKNSQSPICWGTFTIKKDFPFIGNIPEFSYGINSSNGYTTDKKDSIEILAFKNLKILSYGASRNMSKKPLNGSSNKWTHENLFEKKELPNVEDWLLNLALAAKNGIKKAEKDLKTALSILKSGLLPDVMDVKIQSKESENGFENFIEFYTDFGWIRYESLGFGYQTMLTWVLDNDDSKEAEMAYQQLSKMLHPESTQRTLLQLQMTSLSAPKQHDTVTIRSWAS